MKVTGWTNWDDQNYDEFYGTVAAENEVMQAVVDEIRKHGYKFTGEYHQYGDYGAPIIDGKWKYTLGQRRWGHVMVRAYPEEINDSDGYGYVQWAWSAPEPMVVPDGNVSKGD